MSECKECERKQEIIHRLVMENARLLSANPVTRAMVQPEGARINATPIMNITLGDIKRTVAAIRSND